MTIIETVQVIVSLGLLGLCFWLFKTVMDLRHRLEERSQQVQALQADLGSLLDCSTTIGERTSTLVKSHEQVLSELSKLQSQDQEHVQIEHAIRMLDKGKSLADITEIAPLPEGVVAVLVNLQRHRRISGTNPGGVMDAA
ncbi:MAG: hypothetical protein AAF420_12760 [Pseudomonadota bacterium]